MLSHLSDFMKCNIKFWSMFSSFLYVNTTMFFLKKPFSSFLHGVQININITGLGSSRKEGRNELFRILMLLAHFLYADGIISECKEKFRIVYN